MKVTNNLHERGPDRRSNDIESLLEGPVSAGIVELLGREYHLDSRDSLSNSAQEVPIWHVKSFVEKLLNDPTKVDQATTVVAATMEYAQRVASFALADEPPTLDYDTWHNSLADAVSLEALYYDTQAYLQARPCLEGMLQAGMLQIDLSGEYGGLVEIAFAKYFQQIDERRESRGEFDVPTVSLHTELDNWQAYI